MILTSTPNMEEIKLQIESKRPAKVMSTKRKISLESERKKSQKINKKDSSDSDDSENTISDDSDWELLSKKSSFNVEKVNPGTKLKKGDFLLTELTDEKYRTKKQFVAYITNIEENGCIIVSFLRQYKQTTDIFVFPDVADESEIVMKK